MADSALDAAEPSDSVAVAPARLSLKHRLRAYLQLVRLPAVFTAMADIFLGFSITRHALTPLDQFLKLIAASTGLYLAGMALNDVFDRRLDVRERPERPLPSGRVALASAVALGVVLMSAGLASAVAVGRNPAAVATSLALLILAYDGYLKKTPLGPVAMGGCRLLNILLGASAAELVWGPTPVAVALAMGTYVAGVTWFARYEAAPRYEAAQGPRSQLAAAAALVGAGLVGLLVILFIHHEVGVRIIAIAGLWLIGFWINERVSAAIRNPVPANVRSAVKRMLLSIVLLDTTMVYYLTGDVAIACGTAALLVPAATLGRWIFIT